MRRGIILMLITMLAVGLCLGQSTGDYRSAATGNWNVLATWERYNGSAWVTPTAAQGTPTSASGAITIRNGHTVTVTANVTVDQVTVEAGGQVTVNANRTLTIANGAGTDLVCNGTLYNIGTVTVNGTLLFNSGAVYQHARNAGTVPTATWDVNSTCLVTGITDIPPLGLNQNFGNFTWNCPGQTRNINVDSLDNSSLTNIAGNFNIRDG